MKLSVAPSRATVSDFRWDLGSASGLNILLQTNLASAQGLGEQFVRRNASSELVGGDLVTAEETRALKKVAEH